MTKKAILLFAAVSLLYFLLFIPPNATGALDVDMLAVFEVDEYAQYPHVIRMLTPGPTLYQTLRNFTVYLHYFYGYPFYFFSAVALLPVRLALGADWASHTTWIVAYLRQVINILPMLAALLLLVYLQTRFRSWQRSLPLYLFLLSVPAVVVNNLWWHPDSLVFLFVVLTFFFLDQDGLRFGRHFYLAAVACGLATGTKHLGLFFVLAIPLYLLWGWRSGQIQGRRMLRLGALFVLLMTAAVMISNPLLLLPQERAEIIATQKLQFSQTSGGILTTTREPYFRWGQYPADFRIHYGELGFVLLAFLALAAGILRGERRLLNSLILAWMVPLALTVVFTATRRTHYFLPVMLPLYSALVNLFPFDGWWTGLRNPLLRKLLAGLLAVALAAQFILFLRADFSIYKRTLNRQQDSPSLAFYRALQQQVLPHLSSGRQVIYRDWRVYFPQRPGWQVEMTWDLPTYDYLAALNPDLILLERQNVQEFSQPDVVNQAANPGNMQLIHQFYQDAAHDSIPGYRKIYEDNFGLAFVRQGQWTEGP